MPDQAGSRTQACGKWAGRIHSLATEIERRYNGRSGIEHRIMEVDGIWKYMGVDGIWNTENIIDNLNNLYLK